MFIEKYYNQSPTGKISFTRQQASDFAKKIADDFNPLHNLEAKRFCVPGDLLFAVILARSGLYKQMTFTFSGMVNDGLLLTFPKEINSTTAIIDDNKKEYMQIAVAGEHSTKPSIIDALTKAYVEFSGHTFPHILVELMAKNNVMINPARPMIMYQSMSINMIKLEATSVHLKLTNTTLTIEGKRGDACLEFDLISDNEIIGHGKKHMLLSGLRAYCAETMTDVVTQYNQRKEGFVQALK